MMMTVGLETTKLCAYTKDELKAKITSDFTKLNKETPKNVLQEIWKYQEIQNIKRNSNGISKHCRYFQN